MDLVTKVCVEDELNWLCVLWCCIGICKGFSETLT